MLEKEIKDFISQLKFIPENGKNGIFYKEYKMHNSYVIRIDFLNARIIYRDDSLKENEGIRWGDKTTCNFSKEENLVVLECIDRLLEKGYSPASIFLEYQWPLGKKQKGKLDILLFKEEKAFLMIECKTWGNEFEKEEKLMLKNGGQLFSYYTQEKSVKYLILYTSKLEKSSIIYKNLIIKADLKWHELDNTKEIYEHWNKNFYSNGFFEEDINIYDIQTKKLTLKSLKDLTAEDSGIIFNQFAEILRHNVVSDKPNAFNKILNMFICKIIDEDRNENEELKFQVFEDDTSKSLQLRLNDLYKAGMEKFLNIKVSDHADEEISEILDSKAQSSNRLREIYENLRLKKNPEFAFKEVYDDDSFEENAIIIKEIVELLQPYKFRYNHKHQFLGNFFELLLNTSIKQEVGQFFTPVPIAKFIVRSLPLYEFIEKKLEINDISFLPYAIDYAAGSGHFLTEYMDEVQKIMKDIIKDISNYKIGKTITRTLDSFISNPFSWAKEYVYGIEADYRLVKTAKVASFLNGDGDANMIRANGLDNFKESKDYIGVLKSASESKDNQKFDILIANPPYSVNAFKTTIKHGDKSFELFKNITESSSEIECLFIERAKQLLKINGFAGIILPSSFLNNSGIHSKAREIIFKYFDIIAITELGNNTFMATGTNTVILFLKRKTDFHYKDIENLVSEFFINTLDVTINRIENSISKYIENVWKEITYEDYISLVKKCPNDKILNHDNFKKYKNLKLKDENDIINEILKIEKEKIVYFILAFWQKFILIKTGEKLAEKEFLGYEFSTRRGNEGIHSIQGNKSIDECTKLYDPNSFENPKKASTYIYKAFKGEFKDEIDDSLKDNIIKVNLVDTMNFTRGEFDKSISLTIKKKNFNTKYKIEKLGNLCDEIINGGTPSKKKYDYWNKNEVPWLTVSDIPTEDIYITETSKFVSDLALKEKKVKLIPKHSVLLSCTATIGKVGINLIPVTTNQQINALICNKKLNPEYFAYFLREYGDFLKEIPKNLGVKHLNISMLKDVEIPYLDIEIQEQILQEIKIIEKKETEYRNEISVLEGNLKKSIKGIEGRKEKLGTILSFEYGASLVEKNRVTGEFPVVGSNGIVGYHNEWLISGPAIIIGRKGSVGKVTWINKNCYPIDTTFYVKLKNKDIPLELIYYLLKEMNLDELKNGLGVPGLNRNDLYEQIITLPQQSEEKIILDKLKSIINQKNNIENKVLELKVLKSNIFKKYL